MASLVRTPSQRESRTSRCPRPQTLQHNQPPSSRITGAATLPAERTLATCRYKAPEIDRFNPKPVSWILFLRPRNIRIELLLGCELNTDFASNFIFSEISSEIDRSIIAVYHRVNPSTNEVSGITRSSDVTDRPDSALGGAWDTSRSEVRSGRRCGSTRDHVDLFVTGDGEGIR